MFHQVIGEGANIFITIVAIIIGFVGALAYTDVLKVKRDQENEETHEH
jgi:hypothetical protein